MIGFDSSQLIMTAHLEGEAGREADSAREEEAEGGEGVVKVDGARRLKGGGLQVQYMFCLAHRGHLLISGLLASSYPMFACTAAPRASAYMQAIILHDSILLARDRSRPSLND